MDKKLLDQTILEHLNMKPPTQEKKPIFGPSILNEELKNIGMFESEAAEKYQESNYKYWTEGNFDSLKVFLDIFHNTKKEDKPLALLAIKEVLRDITLSKHPTPYSSSHQKLLNDLIDLNVFLSYAEKIRFFRWQPIDIKILADKIAVKSLGIRDYISYISNKFYPDMLMERANYNFLLGGKSSLIRSIISRLSDWGVLSKDLLALDKWHSKFMNWHYKDLFDIENQIHSMLESSLLYGGITDSQKENLLSFIDSRKESEPVKLTTEEQLTFNSFFEKEERLKTIKKLIKNNIESEEVLSNTLKSIKSIDEQIKAGVTGFIGKDSSSSTIKSSDFIQNKMHTTWPTAWDTTSKITVKKPEYIVAKWDSLFSDKIFGEDFSNSLSKKEIAHDPIEDFSKIIKDGLDVNFPITIKRLQGFEALPKKESLSEVKGNGFVSEAKKAGIRIAVTQINRVTKELLVSAIPAEKSKIANEFFNSELGSSFISMVSGITIPYIIKDNESIELVAREFRIGSITTAGNFLINEIIDLVSNVSEEAINDADYFEEEVIFEEDMRTTHL